MALLCCFFYSWGKLLAFSILFYFFFKIKRCADGKDFFEGPHSLLSEMQNKAYAEYSALAEYSVCCRRWRTSRTNDTLG